MKSLELFTGAGGLALGTHLAGFRHVALLEWNRDACETLRHNSSKGLIRGVADWDVRECDISNVDFREFDGVDLVAGGVPCQPFSIGGKHLGREDERDMFPHFVRAIRTLMPSAFVVENVKGLLRESFAEYFSYILLQLSFPSQARRPKESWRSHKLRIERLAKSCASPLYTVQYRLLNSADYGVPQCRERVFVVGFRSDLGANWSFPAPTHSRAALLEDQLPGGTYWRRHGLEHPGVDGPSRRNRPMDFGQLPWVTVRDAIRDLPPPHAGNRAADFANHILNPGAKSYPGHTGSPLDMPAKTLKAGVHGVPGGENMIALPDGTVRYFTVREAARVQTFPDQWEFRGSWSEAMRQLGNAVPVNLAAIVAKALAKQLKTGRNGLRHKSLQSA